jgi:hypothetical protein
MTTAGWPPSSKPRRPGSPRSWPGPTQPLEVGRTSRVAPAAQRVALAIRDRGCVFPHCQPPLAWCEAHHVQHWVNGGPTDLANLALVVSSPSPGGP